MSATKGDTTKGDTTKSDATKSDATKSDATKGDATKSDAAIEIHGYVGCAFAWRVRLVAAEKGLAFDWFPCDVADPAPRALAHNPHEHSPLLYHQGFAHGGFSLLESEVIGAYLDETCEGRPLWPSDPQERALLRMLLKKLEAVDVHTEPSRPDARRKTEPALALLESVLSRGELGEGRLLPQVTEGGHRNHQRDYVHGADAGFVDFMIWPFLFHSAARGFIGASHPAVAAYLARVSRRPSYLLTRTPWAPQPG